MIEINISKEHAREVRKLLKNMDSNLPLALRKAVNNTAKQVRKELAVHAQKTYAVRTSNFNKSMEIKNATQRPVAFITATGEAMELLDFKTSSRAYTTGKNRPDMLKGKVLKRGNLTDLKAGNEKAFIAQFKNKHIAVVQRVPGKRMKKDPKKAFLKKLLSPSIPQMIGNEKDVYGKVDIERYLQENIMEQMEKAGGHKK